MSPPPFFIMEKETIDLLKTLSSGTIAIFGAISLGLTLIRELMKRAFADKDSLAVVVEEQKKISGQLSSVITELKLELSELETLNVKNHSEILKLVESGNTQKLREYLIQEEMRKAMREGNRND